MIRVLISLYKGYGLGDAVQMSSVLRHVRKHRPDWVVDFQAEAGREKVGVGIAHNCFAYGKQPDTFYDVEVQIVLYDTFANWHDRPNTRVTSCLHELFNIEWDRECARYSVRVSDAVARQVYKLLDASEGPLVAVHYSGDSAKHQKDLTLQQVGVVCRQILNLGCTPLILDWREGPLLEGCASVRSLGFDPSLGGDAEWQCAVISQCEAFVGIDSGPSKCASATETPALVVWTGHHPAPFHDPAPNTTHLVPKDYNGLHPVCNDPGVIAWFEANHQVRRYTDELTSEVCRWLSESLS